MNKYILDGMDEAVDDDPTAVGAADGTRILNKEREYSLKPSNSNLVESHELVTPHEIDQNQSSSHLFTDILDGKNLDRIGSSEQASVSPRCIDNSGIMVEELTFRNYSGENLAMVGTSNSREQVHSRQNPWQHLSHKASGSVSGNSHGDAANRDKKQETEGILEEVGNLFFPGFLEQSPSSGENYHEAIYNLPSNDDKNLSSNIFSSGVTRTKIVSKSGSSEYFIKNTLKGKGIIYKGPQHRGLGDRPGNQNYAKSANTGMFSSNAPFSATLDTVMPVSNGIAEALPNISSNPKNDGVILREWLKAAQNKVNKMDNLRIFRQIVKLVDFSHSQGIVLKELWPSCFKLLPSNRIIYLGSSVHTDLSENVLDHDVPRIELDQIDKRPMEQNLLPFDHHCAKKQKFSDNVIHTRRLPHSATSSSFKTASVSFGRGGKLLGPDSRSLPSGNQNLKLEFKSQSRFSVPLASDMSSPLTSVNFTSEEKWYSSPEQLSERRLTFSSNIYSLGVLLFEVREYSSA